MALLCQFTHTNTHTRALCIRSLSHTRSLHAASVCLVCACKSSANLTFLHTFFHPFVLFGTKRFHEDIERTSSTDPTNTPTKHQQSLAQYNSIVALYSLYLLIYSWHSIVRCCVFPLFPFLVYRSINKASKAVTNIFLRSLVRISFD